MRTLELIGPAAPADFADPITLDESVTMAFLAVLDSMTPAQRVAVILHGVFGYSFAEVAAVTGHPPAACRGLASAARRLHVTRLPAAPAAEPAAVVRAFKRAWESGDPDGVVDLLDPVATLIGDGGGLASAALHPVDGDEPIADYLIGLSRAAPGLVLRESTVDGRPGLIAEPDGRDGPVTAFAFDVEGSRITRICAHARLAEAPALGTR